MTKPDHRLAEGQAPAAQRSEQLDALYQAAIVGSQAPSIFSSQPWHWNVQDGLLRLHADRRRLVRTLDQQGRLLTVSCGGALYHARLSLAVAGMRVHVERLPEPAQEDLLARIRVTGPHECDLDEVRRYRSIWSRHTDWRPLPAGDEVGPDQLAGLIEAAHDEGADAHVVAREQVRFLAIASECAAKIEERAWAYGSTMRGWAEKTGLARQNAPLRGAVPPIPRTVRAPELTLRSGGSARVSAGYGYDEPASYLVLTTLADTPLDWLRAGEAASAVMLTAAGAHLAASAMSEIIEVPGARALVAALTPGQPHPHPQLVVRVGAPSSGMPSAAIPRRRPQGVNARDRWSD